MGKKWRQLKYEDRLKIYAWLQDKIPIATIAKRLGVCRQTIYREIKRGEFVKRNTDYTESTVYDPYVAEERCQKNLKERGRGLKIFCYEYDSSFFGTDIGNFYGFFYKSCFYQDSQ